MSLPFSILILKPIMPEQEAWQTDTFDILLYIN